MINLSKDIAAGYSASQTDSWPTYNGGLLDRSKYMTSSEAHQCSRRIKYRKMSPAQGFPNWGYAERGNIIEAWAVKMLRASDKVQLDYAGEEQVSFYDQYQSGTPDGIISTTSGCIVLEIKSVDPRTNYGNLPKPEHIAQVQQNMDLVSHCTGITVHGGVLLYIDASNLQKTVEFVIEPDSHHQNELQQKSQRIFAAATPADLPNEGMFVNGGCDRCEFSEACSALVAGDLSGLERAGKDVFK